MKPAKSFSYFIQTISILSAFAMSAQAQEKPPLQIGDVDAMIEVGAGAVNNGVTFDALIKVDGEFSVKNGSGARFILAKIKTDFSAGGKGVSYVDLQFDTIGYKLGDEQAWIAASLIGADIQRNVVIGNGKTMTLQFLGVSGGFTAEIAQDVKLIMNGAVDLLGVALSERISDGSTKQGYGSGFNLEAGFEFSEKYKIVMGYKQSVVSSDRVSYVDGVACDTYSNYDYDYDYGYGNGYGYSSTYCYDRVNSYYAHKRTASSAYLTMIAELTKSLSAFGQVSYNVYKVRDKIDLKKDSRNDAFQFKLGVIYKI